LAVWDFQIEIVYNAGFISLGDLELWMVDRMVDEMAACFDGRPIGFRLSRVDYCVECIAWCMTGEIVS